MKFKIPQISKTYLNRNKNIVKSFIAPAIELEAETEQFTRDNVRGYILNIADVQEATVPMDPILVLVSYIDELPSEFERVIYIRNGKLLPVSDLSNGQWLKHPSLSNTEISAEERLVSWTKPFSYLKETGPGSYGLRDPQIGALHAIQAHWIVSNEAATVVMPTGTGKTETMLASLVSTPCNRVLVVVPSDALRTQIADKFSTLGILKKYGVISDDYSYPIVAVIKTKPESNEEIDEIFSISNVVITTINIAGQISETLQRRMAYHCEYLFIDEAHHIGAKTWRNLKEVFKSRRILQFTATPFRNDGIIVDGKIIFKYPLKKALDNGYFKKINFKPVSEFDPNKADVAIAEKAIEQLRQDPVKHILMARVDSKQRAVDIKRIYDRYSEFNPIEVHSNISVARLDTAKRDLANGRSRIVICVDMMGEGFDLPELKIAAFHDVRKSLAVTLQLAGRFTRSREDLGEATFIANIADIDVRHELKRLYVHDADWNQLLQETSEEAIGDQLALRQFAEGFVDFPKNLPIQNLYPATSTIVYRTVCDEWTPENFRRGLRGITTFEKIHHSINPTSNTLVIITAKKTGVDWIKLSDVYNWDWELYVLHWDSETKLLYINSSSNSGYFKPLAEAVAGPVKLIQDDLVFRVFSGIKRLRLFNVGLKKQLGRLIRYSMQAGSDVEQGMSEAHKKNVVKSNIFAAGFEGGKKASVGCSRKGRIWSRRIVNVEGLVKWFKRIGKKVLDDSIDPNDVLNGTLKPRRVTERPVKLPFRIDWPESFYTEPENAVTFLFDTARVPLHEVSIKLINADENGEITFDVYSKDYSTSLALSYTVNQDVVDYEFKHIDGSTLKILSKRRELTSAEFFYHNPPVIWFVDGSSLEGDTYTELNTSPIGVSTAMIDTRDWTGTNIRKESQGIDKDQESIQYRMIQDLKLQNYDIIFNDDGPGEAADIVTLKIIRDSDVTTHIELELYHCKFSHEDLPGARLNDLYEVCGQAQRSANWHENPIRLLTHLQKRNPLKESGRTTDRFEKGDTNALIKISRMCELIEVRTRIFIVQPGISKARISNEQNKLLAVTENYLIETYELPLKVITSQ